MSAGQWPGARAYRSCRPAGATAITRRTRTTEEEDEAPFAWRRTNRKKPLTVDDMMDYYETEGVLLLEKWKDEEEAAKKKKRKEDMVAALNRPRRFLVAAAAKTRAMRWWLEADASGAALVASRRAAGVGDADSARVPGTPEGAAVATRRFTVARERAEGQMLELSAQARQLLR